jgi:lipopolysaccharide transport system permease protein
MSTGTVIETEPTTPTGGAGPTGAPTDRPRVTKTIGPRRGWQPVNLAEIWRFRELLFFLVWRDVKVRYKQTVLGGGWALIQPVMTMVVFTIFFGRFGGMAEHVPVPYPVFAYAGLLAWTYFAATIGQAGNSLVSSSNLISKVYFPRIIIPLSAAGVGLVDLAVASGLMFGLLAVYGVALTWQVLLLPVFLALLVASAIGVGTLLAALVIAYRDFRYVLGFLVQLWMFASPLAYPLDVVPERWRLLYALNPMVGVIDGFCAALLGTALRWDVIGVSAASAGLLLVVGLFYFQRVERRFADIV